MKSVFYTGITNDIKRRALEHKSGNKDNFSFKNNCERLVFYENFSWMNEAVNREQQLKAESSQNMIDLISSINPKWKDLLNEL